MIILICYRMQATDAWCLYDSFVCERVKKEIRKRKRKTGKQSSVPPFIFIATKCKMMFALKICERWIKIVSVREREREKVREREKEKLQIERERERENYRECDEYLYFSWMLRSLSLLNICSDCWMRSFWGLEFCDKNHSNNSNILVSSDRFPLLSNLLESIQIRHSGGKRQGTVSPLSQITNFFHGREIIILLPSSFFFFLLTPIDI